MNNSESDGNGQTEFFGAVGKNQKVIIGKSKNDVKSQIANRGISKHNAVLFKWWSLGEKKIRKRLIGKPKFNLTHAHHAAVVNNCLDFLSRNRLTS